MATHSPSDASPNSLPTWDASYPDPERIRHEVRSAADAFVEALCRLVPESDLSGVYLKGSSLKPWACPIDYVPTLSDVDVHVLFACEESHHRSLGSIAQGLALSRLAENLYLERVSNPIHVPRIQLVVANKLFADPDYVPSPKETVEVRLGIPYPSGAVDPARSREAAISRTLAAEGVEYLGKLGDRVADLLGPHLRPILRELSWRVSPTGPRILELRGLDFSTAWTSNRTAIVRLLDSIGERDLAANYVRFYTAAWRYFLSGDRDGEAARHAILAASVVLARGMEIARSVRE